MNVLGCTKILFGGARARISARMGRYESGTDDPASKKARPASASAVDLHEGVIRGIRGEALKTHR